jgi:hypothetical protein
LEIENEKLIDSIFKSRRLPEYSQTLHTIAVLGSIGYTKRPIAGLEKLDL